MVLHDYYCEKCANIYTNIPQKLCMPCQTKDFITSWASENEIIDNFIQKMRKFDNKNDVALDGWIPYSQFNNIKRISKGYSAMYEENYVVLRYLYSNSQNLTNQFLNEVKFYFKFIIMLNI
jgi:hypothetical protein